MLLSFSRVIGLWINYCETIYPFRRGICIPLKCWEELMQQCCVTYHKSGILDYATVKTSKLMGYLGIDIFKEHNAPVFRLNQSKEIVARP